MGSGQVTNNQINLNLIDIIKFCLKIYDLWIHPHLWVVGWMGRSICGVRLNQQKLNKSLT